MQKKTFFFLSSAPHCLIRIKLFFLSHLKRNKKKTKLYLVIKFFEFSTWIRKRKIQKNCFLRTYNAWRSEIWILNSKIFFNFDFNFCFFLDKIASKHGYFRIWLKDDLICKSPNQCRTVPTSVRYFCWSERFAVWRQVWRSLKKLKNC